VRSAPRPLASVPLGGSLRASRAAQLARPRGPLAAVDLADGRALTVEDLGAGWVVCLAADEAPTLRLPPDAPEEAAAPARRRRLGTALVLAGALGAAVVALAGGFSGGAAPAVAGPIASAPPVRPAVAPAVRPSARGGRAAPRPAAKAPPSPAPPPVAGAVAPPTPPPPPPLPELPSAPAL
jgi:hypothetical protein